MLRFVRTFVLVLAVLPATALAALAPWSGLTPGESTADDALVALGPPSFQLPAGGAMALVYLYPPRSTDAELVRVFFDPSSRKIERIVVWPKAALTLKKIEAMYGPACTRRGPKTGCHVPVRITGEGSGIVYPESGIAVLLAGASPTAQRLIFGIKVHRKATPPPETASAGNPSDETSTSSSSSLETETETSSDSSSLDLGQAFAPPANSTSGYVSSRSQYAQPRLDGIVPTGDLPRFLELVEGNFQLKHRIGAHTTAYADVSGFFQQGYSFETGDALGNPITVPSHDVAALHPRISVNELYLTQEFANWFVVTLGKRRINWGTGLAYNPTDLLNPPKDPTDPASQRIGTYALEVEVPFEKATFSFVASPAVLEEDAGLPYQVLSYPSWDKEDDTLHYLLAARAYFLLWDTDLNFMVFYGNKYRDDFSHKLRVGVAISRLLTDALEVHVEALGQHGSSRTFANPACSSSGDAFNACLSSGTAPLSTSKLTDTNTYVRAIAGGRYQFSDDSTFSLEYLFQGDGYTKSEFAAFANVAALSAQANVPRPGGPQQPNDSPSLRFKFDPLDRHYVFLSYMKPKIHDDWTVGATGILNVQDLSSIVIPSVKWSAAEWLDLSLSGLIPIKGSASHGAVVSTGQTATEYGETPFDFRVLFEMRAYY